MTADLIARFRPLWRRRSLWLLLPALALGLWELHRWAYTEALTGLSRRAAAQLDLYVASLQGELDRFQPLPELLAADARLADLLKHPEDETRIAAANRRLAAFNRIVAASDTYLMNRTGLTLAASNWDSARPFVGRNFGFRPYFRQAMEGRLGRYFALGTTSHKRGYYFAYPVRKGAAILGVVAVKVNVRRSEQTRSGSDPAFVVSGPDGVVFLSTRSAWRLHSLHPLSAAARRDILESRRYPGADLGPLPVVSEQLWRDARLLRLREPPLGRVARYLVRSRVMPEAGWTVQVFARASAADASAFQVTGAGAAGLAAALLLGLALWLRQETRRARRHYEQRTRAALEQAKDALEARVAERTAALSAANEHLRHTRDELIQAAKLAALGQMSAGINHELNQPLAAIRSFADNGRLLLQRGRVDEALGNLEQICDLTARMAQIGAQLKVFARRTTGELSDVPLGPVLEGALRILAPAVHKAEARVQVQVPPEGLWARANEVLLQQVLVNLVGNALQALEGRPRREVHVCALARPGGVLIAVEDTGPGIAAEHLPHIFEPFFTTKAAGQGLGLGLSISYRILEEMGGAIRALPGREGARFEIRLPGCEGGHG